MRKGPIYNHGIHGPWHMSVAMWHMCGNVLLDTLSNSHFNYRLLSKLSRSG